MNRFFFIVVLSLCAIVCSAQTGWKFRSDEYGGVGAGENGQAAHLESVNGFYKRSWFFGLGAGLDYYRFRSVPLFLSVKRDLVSFGDGSLSLSLNGGINLPWYKRRFTPQQLDEVVSSKLRAGFWGSAGLGYECRLSPHSSKGLLLSAGYSVKRLEEKLVGATSCIGCLEQVTQQTYYYDYDNRMFLFLVGFQF